MAVQEEFEKYLQERGVNESVALFIPEYSEYKEQSVRGIALGYLFFSYSCSGL